MPTTVSHIKGYVKGDIVIRERTSQVYLHNGHPTHPWIEYLGQEDGKPYDFIEHDDTLVARNGRMVNTYAQTA